MNHARAALVALALCAAPAAQAQEVGLRELSGRWSLETAPHHGNGCVMSGTAQASHQQDDAMRIEVDVTTKCPNGESVRARESCTGRLEQGQLVVQCQLRNPAPAYYVADNFTLDVVSAAAMNGRLHDERDWDEPVAWRRPGPALVS